jgi:UDP-sugar transporter A1/2/3
MKNRGSQKSASDKDITAANKNDVKANGKDKENRSEDSQKDGSTEKLKQNNSSESMKKESSQSVKKIQRESSRGWLMKAAALTILSVQHCLVGLITRQSRTAGSGKFLPQTGVICQEVLKGVVSLVLVLSTGGSLIDVVSSPRELARASVPALLYLVQNNLQYVALGYLDPATYVVTYQLKILSTAIMSVLLLNRELSKQKWVALTLLVAGVSIVQLSAMSTSASDATEFSQSQQLLGLAAVLTTCVLSGLAGVYTEMILKTSPVSLWARNVQLSLCSLLIGALGLAMTRDFEQVRSHGFFYGYNGWVYASVVNNSFGGLLIAAIIKYADNIIKNFATAISIVLTTAASIYALGLTFTLSFFAGVATVCFSTFLYGGLFDDLFHRKLR